MIFLLHDLLREESIVNNGFAHTLHSRFIVFFIFSSFYIRFRILHMSNRLEFAFYKHLMLHFSLPYQKNSLSVVLRCSKFLTMKSVFLNGLKNFGGICWCRNLSSCNVRTLNDTDRKLEMLHFEVVQHSN